MSRIEENVNSIFLVGFMGSGKSTLGIQLSRILKFDYTDLDKRFISTTGKSITDFFAENFEKDFRTIESNILKSLSFDIKTVVACGGGTPCFYDNMEWMNRHGLTVYLNVSPEFLFERLRNSRANRPLVKAMSDDDLIAYIRNELAYRERFYKQSKMTISGAVTATRLKEQIEQYFEFMNLYQNNSEKKMFHI